MFKPTFLYIKEHTETKLKYFGKTTRSDPTKYSGSGKYWLNHINAHGRDKVITLWYKLFTDKDELISFAKIFSEENNISKSDEWANLCYENGTDGGYRENNHFRIYNKLPKSKKQKEKISKILSGRTQSADSNSKRAKTQEGRYKGIPKPLIICRLSDKKEMSATGFARYLRSIK